MNKTIKQLGSISTDMFLDPSDFCKEMWLIQVPESDDGAYTLIDPLNKSIEEKHAFEMVGKICVGSFEEWLFLVDDESRELVLFNLNSTIKVFPPPLDEPFESLGNCVLSLPPTSPDCVIIFSGWEDNFLLICHPNDNKWTKLHLDFFRVNAMLAHNNQLFVFTDEVVIIDIPSLFADNVQMTRVDKPDRCIGCGVYDHLVESCGDLFFVRMITAAIGPPVICFDIHRFDPSSEENWVRVESISNRAIFLARDSGISCCAKDVGVQDDCIYCVMSGYDGERFYKFCLHDQTMSFELLPSKLTQENYSFNWVFRTMPRCITSSDCITSSEVCQIDVQKEVIRDTEDCIFRPWASLPLDLMQLISKYLTIKDCGSLPAVCSAWRLLPNPVREAHVWLMYSPKENGNCFFFDPFEGKIHEFYVGHFSCSDDTRFRFSKDGWIVVSEGYSFYYMLNPFTQDFYQMPTVLCNYPFDGITFSSVPDSPSCVVFAISGVHRGDFVYICTWLLHQEEWSIFRFDNDPPFYVDQTNPVFFRGEFYCLERTGALGVFNPENNTWRVLDRPAPIYSENHVIGSEYCYLVEAKGDLISIFRGNNRDCVRVFRLDLSKMAWIEINDLGDLTLFLDCRSSIARSLPCRGCRNKLYLPRIHDKADATEAFYYSMESGKHNSNFKSLKEPYNCIWFEPNLRCH